MGKPNSKFSPEQMEILDRIYLQNRPLTPEELHICGYDVRLLELTYAELIPMLGYLPGYKELRYHRARGVEREEDWSAVITMNTPAVYAGVKCVRVTPRHGIPLYRGDKHILDILVFLTKHGEWMFATSRPYPVGDEFSGYYKPVGFNKVTTLNTLLERVNTIIEMYELSELNPDGGSFALLLAAKLDDLLEDAYQQKIASLAKFTDKRDRLMQLRARFMGDPTNKKPSRTDTGFVIAGESI